MSDLPAQHTTSRRPELGTALPGSAEQALARLLGEHPDAQVSALSPGGVSIPVPDEVPLGPGHQRAGLDGVKFYVPQDRPAVIGAFEKARRTGSAFVSARLVSDPSVIASVHLLDVTVPFGAFVTVSYGQSGGAATPRLPSTSAEPPRLARIRKTDIAEILDVDAATTSILGWTREEMVGHRSLEFIHPDDQGLAIENWMEMLSNPGPPRRVRLRHRAKHGSWVWFEMSQTNQLADPDPCVLTEMVDISKEMVAQQALEAREQLLHRLTQALPLGVFQTDAEGRMLFANDRLYDIVGLPPTETLTEQLRLVADQDHDALQAAMHAVRYNAADRDLEIGLRLPDQPERRCQVNLRALTGAGSEILGAVGCVSDVTESATLRSQLEEQASTDMLTHCLNRRAIVATLETLLDRPRETSAGTAVVFIDLDEFKHVNDQHGHAAGDELLILTAARLRTQLRDTDLLGRLGGDEFLLICDPVDTPEQAADIGHRIAALLHHQVQLGRTTAELQASVGVAWSNQPGDDADTLIAAADTAMYEAKKGREGQSALAAPQPATAELIPDPRKTTPATNTPNC